MLSVERLPRCVLAVGMAALFLLSACEATPAERATVAIPSPTPTPSPTDPPRRAPTPTPPNGPDARWVGDTLYYVAKDELQTWTDGQVKTISTLPADVVPSYPADDASFSADAERFLITRYSQDGTVRRFIGVTRTGAVTELDLPDATYTEWSPTGETLLVRYPDRVMLRDGITGQSTP